MEGGSEIDLLRKALQAGELPQRMARSIRRHRFVVVGAWLLLAAASASCIPALIDRGFLDTAESQGNLSMLDHVAGNMSAGETPGRRLTSAAVDGDPLKYVCGYAVLLYSASTPPTSLLSPPQPRLHEVMVNVTSRIRAAARQAAEAVGGTVVVEQDPRLRLTKRPRRHSREEGLNL